MADALDTALLFLALLVNVPPAVVAVVKLWKARRPAQMRAYSKSQAILVASDANSHPDPVRQDIYIQLVELRMNAHRARTEE